MADEPNHSVSADTLILLGRLEGKVDSFLAHQSRHDDRITDLERRISVLERGWASAAGLAAGVAGLVSVAADYLIN